MAWIAKVFDKNILDGKVIVIVQYTNGIDTFNEKYETTTQPSTNWIPNIVYNRIIQLDNLSSGILPEGNIIPVNPSTYVSPSTSQEDWDKRFRQLQKIDLLLKYNIIPTTDADLQALKTYLTNNWKTFIKET